MALNFIIRNVGYCAPCAWNRKREADGRVTKENVEIRATRNFYFFPFLSSLVFKLQRRLGGGGGGWEESMRMDPFILILWNGCFSWRRKFKWANLLSFNLVLQHPGWTGNWRWKLQSHNDISWIICKEVDFFLHCFYDVIAISSMEHVDKCVIVV